MTLNLHLMMIHFPIGLLVTYTFFEFTKFFFKKESFFNIRATLLYTGIITAVLAVITGSLIEDDFEPSFPKLLGVHQVFGTTTLILYSLIGLFYILIQFKKELKILEKYSIYNQFRKLYISLFSKDYILYIILSLSILTLIIAGSLGAAMAQGPNIDPVVKLVYTIFIK